MYDDIISKWAYLYDVPIPWIQAVIQKESSWNPNAYNPNDPTGAYGLMQVLYRTATGLGYSGDPTGLLDPDTNIMYGTKLIAQIRQKVGDDVQAMYSMYNSGSSTAYLTPGMVADHVRQFMTDLESVITNNPAIVQTSGLLGVALVAILIWYWSHKKGGN